VLRAFANCGFRSPEPTSLLVGVAFEEMTHEVIRSFDSVEELGEFIDAGANRAPYDEEPFRDQNGEPLTAEQVLDLAREIERETGHKLIFRSGERRQTA